MRGYAERQRSTTPGETYNATTFGGLYYGMGDGTGVQYLTKFDNYGQIVDITDYSSCSVEEIYDNYMKDYFIIHPHQKPTNAKYIIIHRAACEAGLDKNYSGLMGGWCCSSYRWYSTTGKEMFSWPGNFKPFKINDDVKYEYQY